MTFDKLAIIDIETTGSSATYDRIIEVGVLRVENNRVVKTFETLINPEFPISPFIENLTGIASQVLEKAPTLSEIKEELVDVLYDCIFVAHNARFDYSFVKNELKRIGIPYSAKQLCTVKLSRILFPESAHHNLDSIMERFNISCERRHRALADAKVVWDFLQLVPNIKGVERVQKACNSILKKPSLPPNLPMNTVDSLPETPGVYLFFGEGELPLYIGKSVNIRDRVVSHFINDTGSSRELEITQQVRRVESIKTAGELGALLLESELIKKMQPIYNRKLRYKKQLTLLKKGVLKNGYFTAEIETTGEILLSDLESVLGIFKSQKQAKEYMNNLVKEFSLCQNLVGLQKTTTPCFSYHLGYCRGACKKAENITIYNARFIIAFSKTKLSSWPFKGPIIVKEENDDKEEGYIFDKWCYLGKVDEFERKESVARFDTDIYKILSLFLRDPKNHKKIQMLDVSKYNEFLLSSRT